MSEKRLIDYIRKTISSGYTSKQVKEALLKKGWKPEVVDEALNIVIGQSVPENNTQRTPQEILKEYSSKFNHNSLNRDKQINQNPNQTNQVQLNKPSEAEDNNLFKKTEFEEEKDPFEDFDLEGSSDNIQERNQDNSFKNNSVTKEELEQTLGDKKTSGEKEKKSGNRNEKDLSNESIRKNNLNGLKITLIFLIILFLLLLGFGVWYFFFNGADFFNFFS